MLTETFKVLLLFTSISFNQKYIDTDTIFILTNQEKIIFNEPSSLFIIKFLFKEKKIKMNSKMNFEIDFKKFEHTFSQKLWNL